MTTPELLEYLLAHRGRLQNQVIIDCLALASHGVVGRRVKAAELQEVLHVAGASYLSLRMRLLHQHRLIAYSSGDRAEPGYLIHRVGPAQ